MRLETGQRCGPPHVDRSVLLHPAATPTGWVRALLHAAVVLLMLLLCCCCSCEGGGGALPCQLQRSQSPHLAAASRLFEFIKPAVLPPCVCPVRWAKVWVTALEACLPVDSRAPWGCAPPHVCRPPPRRTRRGDQVSRAVHLACLFLLSLSIRRVGRGTIVKAARALLSMLGAHPALHEAGHSSVSSHGPVGLLACDPRALRTFTCMRVALFPPNRELLRGG